MQENPEFAEKLPAEPPEVNDSFFAQAMPRALPNQRTVLNLVGELAKAKSSLSYISWPCGAGKSTCMLEMGHIIGLQMLGQARMATAKVHLVVANADLVAFNERLFTIKQRLADYRIVFEWQSLEAFKQHLRDQPARNLAAEVAIIDEGDLLLDIETNQQLNAACPRHLVLLSAVPQDAWNGT